MALARTASDASRRALIEVKGVRQALPQGRRRRARWCSTTSTDLREGEIVGLLGRSGSGKSTLLRIDRRPDRRRATARSLSAASRSTARPRASRWCSRASRCSPGSPSSRMSRSDWRRSGVADAPSGARRALEAIDLIGLDGFEIRLSEGALRRHAPARRLRPRARRPSRRAADGRAVLGARRAHRRDPAHRSDRPLDRGAHADQVDPDGHPQHRGGGADVRPHPRLLVAIPAASSPKSRSSCRSRATGSIPRSANSSTASMRS